MSVEEKVDPRELPEVGGNALDRSIADFDRACRVLIGNEQRKLRPDNHLVAVLCDSVRLGREYVASSNGKLHEALLAVLKIHDLSCDCDGRGCTICNIKYELRQAGYGPK